MKRKAKETDAELLEIRLPKAAGGGSGSGGGGSFYRGGSILKCIVYKKQPGGYAVYITSDNSPGFLQTASEFEVGTELKAQFVCVHNKRLLLSEPKVDKC